MAYCKNCGQKISEGARFCTNCGVAVESAYAVQETAEEEWEESWEDYSEDEYENPAYEEQKPSVKGKKRKKKKGKRKFWVIAVVVIVFLCLAAASGGKNKSADSVSETEDESGDTLEAASTASDTAESEQDTEYSIAGITFTIPAKYEEDGSVFKGANNKSEILFKSAKSSATEEQFEKVADKLDERMDDFVGDQIANVSRKSALASEVAGFKSRSYCYTGEWNGNQVILYAEWINVTEKEKGLIVMGVAVESVAEEFEADYKKILSFAQYTNASDTVSSDTSDSSVSEGSASSGVDPDLKAFLDEYEAFVDKYVDFMQKYEANPSDLTLLTEYAEVMQEYVDFADKIDAYDSDSMSTADASYYLEVTTRCSQKMLAALGSTGN